VHRVTVARSRRTARPLRSIVAPAALGALWLLFGASAATAQVQGAQTSPPSSARGFLTAPASGDPLDLARDYLIANHAALGLERADLDGWELTDRYTTRHNGLTHLYQRQRLAGIEVFGGYLSVSVTPDGRLIGLRNRFVPGLARAANVRTPSISALEAVHAAAEHLGLTLTAPLSVVESRGGPARELVLSDGGISVEPIPAKLVYHSDGLGGARLAWNLFVRPPHQQHWWNLNVDAVDGSVLLQIDWILNDSYEVFLPPLESPDDGPRTTETNPSDPTASGFGWHDDNGVSGAEYTDTRGNNVWAQDDTDANNSGGFRPDGGSGLDFVGFPLDLTQDPSAYQASAIANLFYWNNVLHDIHYQYGFDEVSGNYQENNYGAAGAAGDPVLADAQDGSGLNNANFSRAADGTSGRMQMYVFQFPGVRIHSPAAIAEVIGGGEAEFGAALTVGGTTGNVVQALDPADAPLFSTTDGCSTLTNGAQVTGNIALIDRGDCTFVQKVTNAQAAGATAALIVNNVGDEVIGMSGTDATITIPSMFIGQTHGNAIKAQLGGGVEVTLSSQVQRDGDLDAGIIVHEYGHGVSIRLSGGPALAGCLSLNQGAGMGEGYGDFWGLALTAKPGDAPNDARPIGSYALGEGPNGPGIRNFPYSNDPLINPQTFASVNGTNQPHGVGEIWAQALWEVYWNLVGAHGFDPDLYGGSGGNNIVLQLVMDGLKMHGCEPTFLQARDAILDADLVDYGGANQCLIWQGFAKRGMGVNADDTGNPRRLQVTEDFSVPAPCTPVCGNGVLDAGEQCDDGDTQDGDCCSSACQFESVATECRASAGACDVAEFCTGDSGTCPGDDFAPDTTECRAAVDVCDGAELCTGSSAECPPDAFEPDTTECRASAGACDLPEFCSGTAVECGPDLKSTAECRPAGGTCDVAEFCDGVSDLCPANAVDPGLCADGNPCTTESCVSLECQIEPVANGTSCVDDDVCNGDETCQSGICSAGPALDCSDGDPCTADGCDGISGCFNDPIAQCQPPGAVPGLPLGGLLTLSGLIAMVGVVRLRGGSASRS
jgi:extracellular elastinolytic metalloproteinase